ncbi:MAG: ATP-binding cassette domain-containing protein, partial [Blastocatellia bacterium]
AHKKMEGEIVRPSKDGRESRISVVPQSYRESFFDWANLRTNLVMTCPSPLGKFSLHVRRIERLKKELQLGIDLKLKPRQCSGGMVQQAALIRGFVNDPDLILADEPFSALDVEVANHVRRSFRNRVRQQGIVAIVILHDLEDILEVCDKVFVVSGKPFSTSDIPGHTRAYLLENKLLGLSERKEGQKDETFLEIMKRLLSEGVQNGRIASPG